MQSAACSIQTPFLPDSDSGSSDLLNNVQVTYVLVKSVFFMTRKGIIKVLPYLVELVLLGSKVK